MSKLITGILPIGTSRIVMGQVFLEYGIIQSEFYFVRSVANENSKAVGWDEYSEREVLTITVPDDISDDVFMTVCSLSEIDKPNSGLIYIQDIIKSSTMTLDNVDDLKNDCYERIEKFQHQDIIYVATPRDINSSEEEYGAALKHVEENRNRFNTVFLSPILHSNKMQGFYEKSQGQKNSDLVWLTRCSRIDVLKVGDWENSSALMLELAFAKKIGIKINYFDIK